MEDGTLIKFALRPHPPTVLGNDALDQSQANARTLEFLLAVETLENTE